MRLQFESNQKYQLDAIQAVVDIFAGQPRNNSGVIAGQVELGLEGQQLSLEAASARSNVFTLAGEQIVDNVHEVQRSHGLPLSETVSGTQWPVIWPVKSTISLKDGMNFSTEMETGTGKTYVYLRTIHELHENYGWKKFIIVVPSVAIREGVLKNLEITKEHFAELYNKPEMNYYVWDSKKTGQAREFATNDTLQIMVITIDSFAKSQNIMNKESDYGRPLDFIRATHPVIIMDEPQNMETEIRKNAIDSLNPLCTLRYSATHKNAYNMLYRLTPVDAYDQGLVKKIEVHSVLSEDNYNDAYMSLKSVEHQGKGRVYARIELNVRGAKGATRKVVKVTWGDDLQEVTHMPAYAGHLVGEINYKDQTVQMLEQNKTLHVGQKDENLHEEILKRQIELAVRDHFEKQQIVGQDIKVLSLFFIDRVANYRNYTETGVEKGKFALWFEEAYEKVRREYPGILDNFSAADVHNGYFASDKNGHWKDSKDTKGEGGKTKDDDGAYSLIMKDKEKLLDPNEPLRFIFSHSALREGWDNPNVFVICTLNESSSEMKKRQEIGRGLRLPVDTTGERVRNDKSNILTVVANESYEEFSRKLQTEIKDETGLEFPRIENRDDRKKVSARKRVELDPSFEELWNRIKHKTIYRVNIDVERFLSEAKKELDEVVAYRPVINSERRTMREIADTEGGNVRYENSAPVRMAMEQIPDVLSAIVAQTGLTRKIVFEVLDASDMFSQIPKNPQDVIDKVSDILNRIKNQLAVDGIRYEKTGEEYEMALFKDDELYAYLYDAASTSGAIEVEKPEKTVYDYVNVDSSIELKFVKELEDSPDVKFYVKLPGWFTIDTPVGTYNPDWAVAFHGDEQIYFVAETKGSSDIHDDHIAGSQLQKIKAGTAHFSTLDVPYAAPVANLQDAIRKARE